MTFADQIRPLIELLGTTESARICGVTPRSLQLWMRGATPNAATQAGAVLLLARAAKSGRKTIQPTGD